MTKNQIIDQVAKATGMTKKSVAEVFDAISATVDNALVAGESVQISGFGIFSVKQKDAYTGRNPKTGETIQIAASKKPAFSPSKAFKDEVNG